MIKPRFLLKFLSLSLVPYICFLFPTITVSQTLNYQDKEKDFSINDKLEKNLQSDTYILGPGDILSLIIFNNSDFNQDVEIISDGSASIPLVGMIRLSGLSIIEAQKKIKSQLNNELIEPQIQLSLKKQRPIKVTLIGEVERPGIYSLTVNEQTSIQGVPSLKISGIPTVIDAIQKAGGVTKSANLTKVHLGRLMIGENNQYKTTTLNFINLITKGEQINNPLIFDGDVIKIEKANDNSELLETLEVVSANFAPKAIKVYIAGEVKNPGPLEVSAKTVLNQAIYMAGGPKAWRTNRANIRLYRFNRNGSIYKKRFKFSPNSSISTEKNPLLQDGDVVVVSGTVLAKATDTIKTFAEPIGGMVSIYSLYKIIDAD